MNEQDFVKLGMNESTASAYVHLLKNGEVTPKNLAEGIDETRANGYAILGRLEEMGLAVRDESQKKLKYRPAHPSALADWLANRRTEQERREQHLQNLLPQLTSTYFTHNEQAGVRFFEGKQGLLEIYEDQLGEGCEIKHFHVDLDRTNFNFSETHLLRNKFPAQGIERHVVVSDVQKIAHDENDLMPVAKSDRLMKLHRTWIEDGEYTAPVEWAVYGDKLSIIAFGEDAMGLIIDSPKIAEGFRQIFDILTKEIENRPNYSDYPQHLTHTKIPESAKQTTWSV